MKKQNSKRLINAILSFILSICFVITGLPVKAAQTIQEPKEENLGEVRAIIGTTYYVDDKSGNDSNDGMSPETAWQSLDKLNGTTFSAGDKLLFKRGGVWTGQLSPNGSGAPGNPIIIASYGEGAKPLIQGNSLIKNDDAHPENQQFNAAVYFYNQEYWEITELEITNKDPNGTTNEAKIDENKKYGVLIMGQDAGTLRHMYCQDLYVHDIVFIPEGQQAGIGRGGIIYAIRGNKKKTNWDDIVVENSQIGPSVNHYGINFISTWGSSTFQAESGIRDEERGNERVNSTNLVIRNNYCVDIGNAAICPTAYENALIENNVCDTCNSGPNGNVPIWWENGNYTIAQKNEVFNSGATPGKEDSQAFDADVNAKLNYIQYNYTHDNPSGAFFECALGTQYTTYIRYNISQNDGAGHNSYGQGSIVTLGGSSGNSASKLHIYNNTFYLGNYAGAPCESYILRTWGETFNRDNPENFQFKNNLIINDGNSKGYHYNDKDAIPSITGTFSNNAYGGTNVNTIKPVDRQETNSLIYGENGISDPYFAVTAPGQGGTSGRDTDGIGEIKEIKELAAGYKLKDSSSPLIGKGILINDNGGYDYWENPVSSVNAPNIGADNNFADLNGGSGGGDNTDGNSIINFEDLSVEEGTSQSLINLYQHCNFGQGMWNVKNTAKYGTELYANSLTDEQQVCKIALPEGIILKGFKARSDKSAIIKVVAGEEEKDFALTSTKQEFQTQFQGASEAVYFIISSPTGAEEIKLDDIILAQPEGGIKNVALHKPAIANGTSQYDPSNAVDGDEGTLWVRDLSQGNDNNHWLQVDLKKEYQINEFKVVFENNTDPNQPWQYKIEGSNNENFTNPIMLSDQRTTTNTSKQQNVSCTDSRTFRYVRITFTQLGLKPGDSDPWPALAELEVLADTGSYQNVAFNKPSEQNAQDSAYGKPASNVNDGNKDTIGGSLNIANGDGGGEYIWTVDLEEVKHIAKTEIVFPPKGNDIPDPDNKWIPDWKYKIEYSNDKATWATLADYTIDPSSNPNKESLTQIETCNIDCQYMRVTIKGGPTAYPNSWAVIAEFSAFSPIKSIDGADATEPGQIVNHNLAYAKPVLSNDNAKDAEKITDNDSQTGWIPSAAAMAQIDFGKTYHFSEFNLQYEDNSAEKQYKIFVSQDKENWIKIVDKSTNTDKTTLQTDKKSAIGRYIKIEFNGTAQKLMEFKAYGTEADREKRKVMIIVPHEDDEVLAGGGIIKDATLNGDNVKVVIGTNGDFNGQAAGKNRIEESIAALTNLNVKQKDMIFMGYADNGGLIGRWGQEVDDSQLYQMYMAADENKLIPSKNGNQETYGQDSGGKQDYHFEYTGEHAEYTRKNFLNDLMHAIKEFEPTDIYSTSMYDMHSDHAYINLFVREAILELQKEDNNFQPTLWDGIVHSVAGDTDLGGATNWPAHGEDVTKALEEPNNLEEATTFDWNKRVSVTVPYQMRQPAPLKYSLKEQTLRLYGSQYMSNFIADFSRHDEVFWEKPFTSLSYLATVNVSSNKEKANSIIDGIESGYIPAMEKLDFTSAAKKKRDGFPDAEWAADGTTGEWIELQWEKPQSVKKIVLYDRPDPDQNITSGKITFDDGTTQDVGKLPANGRPYEIILKQEKVITSLKFEITGVSNGTNKAGLAEIEVYGTLKTIDKTQLQELIDQAKAINNDNNQYTKESYQALQEAILKAEEELVTINSEKLLKAAIKELQTAIDNLVAAGEEQEKLNKQPLIDKIAEAEKITNNNGEYTKESYEALKKAIEQAKQKLETVTTNIEVNDAVNNLQYVIDALQKSQGGGSDDEQNGENSGGGSSPAGDDNKNNDNNDKKDSAEETTTTIKDPVTGEEIGEIITIVQEDKETGTIITTTLEKNKDGVIVKGKTEVKGSVSNQEIEGRTSNLLIKIPEKELLYAIEKGSATISIQIPQKEVIKQVEDGNIKSVTINLVIPKSIAESKKAAIEEIILKKEALKEGKKNVKNITVAVKNENGKEYYSWKFEGNQLKQSTKVTDTNLSMWVYPVKTQNHIDNIINKENNKSKGLVFNFKHSGELPSQADLKVYVENHNGWEAGKKVYLYYYNESKNKLVEQKKNKYKVDKQGCVTIKLEHCSDYVLLPSIPTGKNVISFLDKISVPKKLSIKKGKTAILKIKNNSEIAITKKFSTNKTSVVKVTKSGKITTKKKGKAIINTQIIANGKKKTYKTKVIVKK